LRPLDAIVFLDVTFEGPMSTRYESILSFQIMAHIRVNIINILYEGTTKKPGSEDKVGELFISFQENLNQKYIFVTYKREIVSNKS